MTVPTIQFEGRLKAIGATSAKDGNWTKVEFQVHPSDDVSQMLRAGLNSRWQVVVVQLDDQDQPVTPKGMEAAGFDPVKPKGGELARRAGILCGDERFQKWAQTRFHGQINEDVQLTPHSTPERAAAIIRMFCGVDSRAGLDHNPEAAEKFKALEFEFKQAHGLVAERTR